MEPGRRRSSVDRRAQREQGERAEDRQDQWTVLQHQSDLPKFQIVLALPGLQRAPGSLGQITPRPKLRRSSRCWRGSGRWGEQAKLQDADPTASDDSHPVQPQGLLIACCRPSKTNGDRWALGTVGSVVSCMGRAGIEPATLSRIGSHAIGCSWGILLTLC